MSEMGDDGEWLAQYEEDFEAAWLDSTLGVDEAGQVRHDYSGVFAIVEELAPPLEREEAPAP